MKKKNVPKRCSSCKCNIPEDSEFIEFKGNFFHPDKLICIGNLKVKLESIGEILGENGCNCDCDHDPESHDDDCERCLACRVGEALGTL